MSGNATTLRTEDGRGEFTHDRMAEKMLKHLEKTETES